MKVDLGFFRKSIATALMCVIPFPLLAGFSLHSNIGPVYFDESCPSSDVFCDRFSDSLFLGLNYSASETPLVFTLGAFDYGEIATDNRSKNYWGVEARVSYEFDLSDDSRFGLSGNLPAYYERVRDYSDHSMSYDDFGLSVGVGVKFLYDVTSTIELSVGLDHYPEFSNSSGLTRGYVGVTHRFAAKPASKAELSDSLERVGEFYFDFDSDDKVINSTVHDVALFLGMLDVKDPVLYLVSYADSSETETDTLTVGRHQFVREWLIDKGISSNDIVLLEAGTISSTDMAIGPSSFEGFGRRVDLFVGR